jgi:hypothetical protein
VIARRTDPAENVAELGVVVEQPQQRFAAGAPLADAEDILRGGIQINDEQVPVRLIADIAIVAGAAPARWFAAA